MKDKEYRVGGVFWIYVNAENGAKAIEECKKILTLTQSVLIQEDINYKVVSVDTEEK